MNQTNYGELYLSVGVKDRFFRLNKNSITYIGRINDAKFPDINTAKPKETEKTVVFEEKSMTKALSSVTGQFKKGDVELYGFENETMLFTSYENTLSKNPIGVVKSDVIDQKKTATSSYMLLAGSPSTNPNGLKYQYKDLKIIINASKYKAGTIGLLFFNGIEKKVQFLNLKSLDEIQKGDSAAPKAAVKITKPKPPKEESVAEKKMKLEQAIKGMEILVKKGNKVAEATLKGLKILYKKM
jgi:hypothetical protein